MTGAPWLVLFRKYNLNERFQEDETGRLCSRNGRDEDWYGSRYRSEKPLVKTALNPRISKDVGKFLGCCTTGSVSKRAHLQVTLFLRKQKRILKILQTHGEAGSWTMWGQTSSLTSWTVRWNGGETTREGKLMRLSVQVEDPAVCSGVQQCVLARRDRRKAVFSVSTELHYCIRDGRIRRVHLGSSLLLNVPEAGKVHRP